MHFKEDYSNYIKVYDVDYKYSTVCMSQIE